MSTPAKIHPLDSPIAKLLLWAISSLAIPSMISVASMRERVALLERELAIHKDATQERAGRNASRIEKLESKAETCTRGIDRLEERFESIKEDTDEVLRTLRSSRR